VIDVRRDRARIAEGSHVRAHVLGRDPEEARPLEVRGLRGGHRERGQAEDWKPAPTRAGYRTDDIQLGKVRSMLGICGKFAR
jgi:hypothetical protein